MKIIDILNKIANGEKPPKKIAFKEQEYEYDIGERDYYYCNGAIYWLFDEYAITDILNEKIEILDTIENNKIRRIDISKDLSDDFNEDGYRYNICQLADKINEIIDHIQE